MNQLASLTLTLDYGGVFMNWHFYLTIILYALFAVLLCLLVVFAYLINQATEAFL